MPRFCVLGLLFVALASVPAAIAQSPPSITGVPVGADADGDGVPADRDGCRATPAGSRAVVAGCALIELLDPNGAIADLRQQLAAASSRLGQVPSLRAATKPDRAGLGKAAGQLRAVSGAPTVCGAATRAQAAASSSRTAASAITLDVKSFATKVLALRKRTRGATRVTTPAQQRLIASFGTASAAQKATVRAAHDTGRLAGALKTLCSRTGAVTTRSGKVATAAGRQVKLADGTTVLLDRVRALSLLGPGLDVSVKGTPFGGPGTLVATEISIKVPTIPPITCEPVLEVAPPQAITGAPLAYYPLTAYYAGQSAVLEYGASFGVKPSAGCTGTVDQFVAVVGTGKPSTTTIDHVIGIVTGEPAKPTAMLTEANTPFDSDHSVLRIQVAGYRCPSPGTCSLAGTTQIGRTLKLHGGEYLGDFQHVRYVRDVFYPETNGRGRDAGRTDGVRFDWSPVPARSFGYGRPVSETGALGPAGSIVDQGSFFGVTLLPAGTENASPFSWAFSYGQNNGGQFVYSADPVPISTDGIAECALGAKGQAPPPAAVTLYRLPFAAKVSRTISLVFEGNVQFRGPTAGSPAVSMVAMRGGRVIPDGNYVNYIRILHQDGTVGNYIFDDDADPKVEVGDVVERGERIAVAREVSVHVSHGPGTGMDAFAMAAPGAPISVDSSKIDGVPTVECLRPAVGQTLTSDNAPTPDVPR